MKFGDKTMYQSDFKYHPLKTDSHRKLKKRIGTCEN